MQQAGQRQANRVTVLRTQQRQRVRQARQAVRATAADQRRNIQVLLVGDDDDDDASTSVSTDTGEG